MGSKWLLLGVALASTGAVAAERAAFGPGEQLTFEVSLLGIPAGKAQVTVGWEMEQFGASVWPLVCIGETTNVAQAFNVKDRFVSYFDPSSGRSLGADFFVQEGNYRRRERYRYAPDQGKIFTTKQSAGRDAVDGEYESEPSTMDLAGAAFRLRNEKLAVGQRHEMPIFTGTKVYQLHALVDSKETVTTKLGTFETFKVRVNGDFNGKLATKGDMTLYLTTDDRHVPVRMSAEFVVGSILIDAVKYEPGREGAL